MSHLTSDLRFSVQFSLSCQSRATTLFLVMSVLMCSWAGMGKRAIAQPDTITTPQTEAVEPQPINTERKQNSTSSAGLNAYFLLQQAVQLFNRGQFQSAVQPLQQALVLFRQAGDRRGEGDALSSLGTLYIRLEQYPQAVELLQQALIIRREVQDRIGEAITLNSLGGAYLELEEYSEALDLLQQTLVIRREVDDRHGEAITLSGIGTAYGGLEEYTQAISAYRESIKIRREVGDRSGAAGILILLGKTYIGVGQFREALEQYEQAQLLYRELRDQNGEASSLNGIGEAYNNLGEYPKSLEYFQQALSLFRATSNRSGEATVLNNMGTVYNSLGQYSQELELYQQALLIVRETRNLAGEAAIYNNIADTYAFLGENSQALDYYQQALVVFRDIYNRFGEAAVLNGLGSIYRSEQRYSEALEHYQKSLEILQELDNRSMIGNLLGNLGLVAYEQQQYSQALDYTQQFLAIAREIGNRLNEITALGNISVIHWTTGNLPLALDALRQETTLREEDLGLILAIGSDAQKQDYMATLAGETSSIISFHLQETLNNSEVAELALTTVLQRKGRVLEASSDTFLVLRQHLTPENQTLLDELQFVETQRANAVFGDTAVDAERLRGLENRAEELQNLLAQRSAEFRAETQPVSITAIQQQIPADAALVELVRYQPFNYTTAQQEQWGAPRYAAYVLRRDGEPRSVDLGEAAPIDAQVFAFREALRRSQSDVQPVARALDAQLMQPIRALVGDATHLLISPDGQLSLIPFSALVDENNQYLIERYIFTYLSSGRGLLRVGRNTAPRQGAVLVANPDFGQAESQFPIAADIEGDRPTSTTATRSVDFNTLTTFAPLPGTQQEAEAIAPLLPNLTLLEGSQATEERLKQVQGPSILHIATHGFFLQDQECLAVPNARGGLGNATVTIEFTGDSTPCIPTPRTVENPLLRSGLVLAGANGRSQRQNNSEDGILTAQEVTQLDLYGTQLVVLSACETGVGNVVNGEGVYGLRRAFELAGAESELMSLWKVDDMGTSQLMSLYYQHLMAGEGRSAALRDVQLELLNTGAYNHPYYWASFIFSGEWQPLEN